MCRAPLFLPLTCLVVVDILVLLHRDLGVVVEVVVSLQHSEREPIFESTLFVQLSWLYSHVSPKQVDRK